MQPPCEVAGYLCIPTLRQWIHSSAMVKLDESTLYVQSLHLALEPFPFVGASEFSCHITSSHILHCFLPKAPSASLFTPTLPQLFPMSCQQHYHCSLLYYSSSFTGIFHLPRNASPVFSTSLQVSLNNLQLVPPIFSSFFF